MSEHQLKALLQSPNTQKLAENNPFIDYYTCIANSDKYFSKNHTQVFWVCAKGYYTFTEAKDTLVDHITVCKYIPEQLQKAMIENRRTHYKVCL